MANSIRPNSFDNFMGQPFDPYQTETYESRRLDSVLMAVRQEFGKETYLHDPQLQIVDLHHRANRMACELKATLWKERVQVVAGPQTWWDHFKATYPEWMPMWASEPQYKSIPLDRCYADINPIPGKPYMYIAVRQ